MDKTDFMAHAIAISSRDMLEKGCAPFAAVIVKDGKIVGEGCNHVVANHDPTSHGEVEAIRNAGRSLGTWDLSVCELYTTCEPCVASMYWARIDNVYFVNTLKDCEDIGFELTPLRELHARALPAERLLGLEGREVLDLWIQQPSFNRF